MTDRESILADDPRPCMACGKPTRRYVIVDWNWSCGPACDAVLDGRLADDLDRLNARQDYLPADEDDLVGF